MGKDIALKYKLIHQKKVKKKAKFHFTGVKDILGKEIYNGDTIVVCNGSINNIKWKDKPYKIKYRLNKGFNLPFFCWNEKGKSIMDSTHYCFKKTKQKYYYIEFTEYGILPKTLFYSKTGNVIDFNLTYFTTDKKELENIAGNITGFVCEIIEL